MKLRTKMLMNSGLLIALSLIITAIAWVNMMSIHNMLHQVSYVTVPGTKYLGAMSADVSDYRRGELQCIVATDAQVAAEERQKMANILSNYQQSYTGYLASIDKAGQEYSLAVKQNHEWQDYLATSKQTLAYDQANNKEAAINSLMNSRSLYQQLVADINSEVSVQDREAQNISAQGEDTFVHARTVVLAVALFALVLGILSSLYLAGSIVRAVKTVQAGAELLAAGKLTAEEIRVRTKDEMFYLAQAFNKMAANLRELVRSISETAHNLGASSEELSAMSEESASSATSTSASASEIGTTIEQVSNDMQSMAGKAEQVNSLAKEGQANMGRLNNQVGRIGERVNEINSASNKLRESAAEITTIVATITGIADQTNLLALNAAIEAARAGEQGRGFAVVAEEIRKLAHDSSEAAKKIGHIVSENAADTNMVSDVVDKSSQDVASVLSSSTDVSSQFAKIVDAVGDINDNVRDMAETAQNMMAGVENIVAAVQQQSGSAEQVSASAQSLASVAMELQNLVGKFEM